MGLRCWTMPGDGTGSGAEPSPRGEGRWGWRGYGRPRRAACHGQRWLRWLVPGAQPGWRRGRAVRLRRRDPSTGLEARPWGSGFPFAGTRPANAHAYLLRNSRPGCLLVGLAAPSLPAPSLPPPSLPAPTAGQAAESPTMSPWPLEVLSHPCVSLPHLRAAPPASKQCPPHGTGTDIARRCRSRGALGRFPSPLGAAWCQGKPTPPPAQNPISCPFRAKSRRRRRVGMGPALGGPGAGVWWRGGHAGAGMRAAVPRWPRRLLI